MVLATADGIEAELISACLAGRQVVQNLLPPHRDDEGDNCVSQKVFSLFYCAAHQTKLRISLENIRQNRRARDFYATYNHPIFVTVGLYAHYSERSVQHSPLLAYPNAGR